jgi:hypothetical protein
LLRQKNAELQKAVDAVREQLAKIAPKLNADVKKKQSVENERMNRLQVEAMALQDEHAALQRRLKEADHLRDLEKQVAQKEAEVKNLHERNKFLQVEVRNNARKLKQVENIREQRLTFLATLRQERKVALNNLEKAQKDAELSNISKEGLQKQIALLEGRDRLPELTMDDVKQLVGLKQALNEKQEVIDSLQYRLAVLKKAHESGNRSATLNSDELAELDALRAEVTSLRLRLGEDPVVSPLKEKEKEKKEKGKPQEGHSPEKDSAAEGKEKKSKAAAAKPTEKEPPKATEKKESKAAADRPAGEASSKKSGKSEAAASEKAAPSSTTTSPSPDPSTQKKSTSDPPPATTESKKERRSSVSDESSSAPPPEKKASTRRNSTSSKSSEDEARRREKEAEEEEVRKKQAAEDEERRKQERIRELEAEEAERERQERERREKEEREEEERARKEAEAAEAKRRAEEHRRQRLALEQSSDDKYQQIASDQDVQYSALMSREHEARQLVRSTQAPKAGRRATPPAEHQPTAERRNSDSAPRSNGSKSWLFDGQKEEAPPAQQQQAKPRTPTPPPPAPAPAPAQPPAEEKKSSEPSWLDD